MVSRLLQCGVADMHVICKSLRRRIQLSVGVPMSYNFASLEESDRLIEAHLTSGTQAQDIENGSSGARADGPVPAAMIVANGFVQQGLLSYLEGTRFQIVATIASSSEVDALSNGHQSVELIIAAPEDAVRMNAICALHAIYPEAKLLVFGSRESLRLLPKHLRLSAHAVLGNEIDRATLITTLDVVMAGASVQSAGLLAWLADPPRLTVEPSVNRWPNIAVQDAADLLPEMDLTPSRRLTSRELTVLQSLATGASNKMIARQFDLSECTVKIHVKNILRKLQMQNRTQAALWAQENGVPG
ncbi:helix-turn-helix transcriptional regulator [Methylobacterium planeticum]|uniref:Response regulator transcription factor n=1 Tax=Methylobacterium planeticum TaxID=2615211 RepID=A0A6N6MNH0_9HYPH|nr:response regulator transcription factor [Methylobacterium planeticum]KAB1069944.1 response regulator transcription factor [Methylobacterium planeticum]